VLLWGPLHPAYRFREQQPLAAAGEVRLRLMLQLELLLAGLVRWARIHLELLGFLRRPSNYCRRRTRAARKTRIFSPSPVSPMFKKPDQHLKIF
jgi:hypothetical protein